MSPLLSARVQAAAEGIRRLSPFSPSIGLVLGSGLGAFGDTLEGLVKIPYDKIEGMPTSTVVGHAGNLCLGSVGNARVACLQGRSHLYEGHSIDVATFGVRVLARLGCRVVLLTNAAGGINASFAPGELMLISDHLNLTGQNPLVGPNDSSLGPRFPDMTNAYDPWVRSCAREAAKKSGVLLREGVYAGLLGPTYETPAEIRMLRTLGADAVGMSTVAEVIALRHLGIRVGAISCITNLGAGMSPNPLDHSEVEATATRVRNEFARLLGEWLARVSEAP